MTKLKQIAKNVAGKTLIRTGLWRRHLEKMARRGEGIVLTYHRLIEKWDRTLDYSQPGMIVTTDTFDRQLQFLKKHFSIVPLSSLVNSKFEIRNSKCSDLRNPQSEIPNSKFGRPMCALTFDDGWRDNYEIAFPILRQHGVPATIFLTTDLIATDRTFWHTELMYLLMHGDVSRYRLVQYVLQGYPSPVSREWRRLARWAEPPSAHDIDPLVEAVKETCGGDEIDNLIWDLRHALGRSGSLLSQRPFFLDWEQVSEMSAAGIEIGSHGCSHGIFTRLKPEEVEEELTRSKAQIEARIGQAVQHFAFPGGGANAYLTTLVGKAGYRTASVSQADPGGRRKELLTLRRLGMHEGVSQQRDGSFSEAALVFWLLRAPRKIWT